MAWLASRLGWEAAGGAPKAEKAGTPGEERGSGFFSFHGRAGDTRVRLIPRRGASECAAGFIAIELNAAGDIRASFSLTCGGDKNVVFTRIETAGRPPISQTVHLEVLDEAGLLNEELKFPNRDRLYEEVLGVLATLRAS